jgi:hypothetical protein
LLRKRRGSDPANALLRRSLRGAFTGSGAMRARICVCLDVPAAGFVVLGCRAFQKPASHLAKASSTTLASTARRLFLVGRRLALFVQPLPRRVWRFAGSGEAVHWEAPSFRRGGWGEMNNFGKQPHATYVVSDVLSGLEPNTRFRDVTAHLDVVRIILKPRSGYAPLYRA